MTVDLERATRLRLLVRHGNVGDAESEATNEEERELVAQMRLSEPNGAFIETPIDDFDFGSDLDDPDFDYESWEADGMPDDTKPYIREYTPKPFGWMPSDPEESSDSEEPTAADNEKC
jgi:hypothetical protein